MLVDSANVVCIETSDYSLRAGKQKRSYWLRISKTLMESLKSVYKEIG